MGCSSSKQQASSAVTTTATTANNNSNSNNNKQQVLSHPTQPPSPPPSSLDGSWVWGNKLTVHYAARSRQGRDPEIPAKPNQDVFGTFRMNDYAFFGVYDGHGPTGETCAAFVANRLPQVLRENLQQQQQATTLLNTDQVQDALDRAYIQTNQELHANPDIDDQHSGTTAITVFLHHPNNQPVVVVANVGDSRAILGTTQQQNNNNNNADDGGWQGVPLSNDQTPRREDEAKRCQEAGARILSFGQLLNNNNEGDNDNNNEGTKEESSNDPPRVWAPQGNYPGTAFTRSLGDALAESLGVLATPEILTLPMTRNERCIVLASDGIFDVLSNQQVVDICAAHDNKPADACASLLEQAHAEWLKNEDCDGHEELASYDDMTVICLFLQHAKEEEEKVTTTPTNTTTTSHLPPPTQQQQEEQQLHPHRKRVRQKTLKNLDEMLG